MPATATRVPTASIRFDPALYPRSESQSPATAQEYALSLAEGRFPPLLLTQDGRILDGWHRWKAALLSGVDELDAEILDCTGLDLHTMRRQAARANVRHGLPQTEGELKQLIRDEYRAKVDTLDQAGREALKKTMALDYSRSLSYVRECTNQLDKHLKAALREQAFQRWLACQPHKEIAQAIGYSEAAVSVFVEGLQEFRNASPGVSEAGADLDGLRVYDEEEADTDGNRLGTYRLDKRLLLKAHHVDETFRPPLYNLWRQQDRTPGPRHFGNSEVTWLDNLLYLYTRPLDIVIDPFAGSGSTIDLCKQRLRRYLVSDRAPSALRTDIRPHDVTTGVLAPPSWQQVRLVYLDPPYWKQAEGRYSDAPTDLANMDLEAFTQTLADLIAQYATRLKRARATAHIALFIQATQWNAPEHRYTDHLADIIREVKLPIAMRLCCPYETSQALPTMVEWAKKNRTILVLARDLIVWSIS